MLRTLLSFVVSFSSFLEVLSVEIVGLSSVSCMPDFPLCICLYPCPYHSASRILSWFFGSEGSLVHSNSSIQEEFPGDISTSKLRRMLGCLFSSGSTSSFLSIFWVCDSGIETGIIWTLGMTMSSLPFCLKVPHYRVLTLLAYALLLSADSSYGSSLFLPKMIEVVGKYHHNQMPKMSLSKFSPPAASNQI